MAEFRPRLMQGVLPNNATEYERVMASMVERLLEIDADEIRHLWDPWRCRIDLLPYLAWSLSVDIWVPEWPEVTKRRAVARALEMHQLKGTEEGIRRYLELVGATLRRTIAPPARGFYTPAMTEASRRAWLQGLPQIRVYPFLTRRTAPRRRAFYDIAGQRRSFYGAAFAQDTHGPELYGRRATFYDQGVEVEANYEVLQDPDGLTAERVLIQRSSRKRSFYNRSHFGHASYQASTAAENVLSVRLNDAAVRQFAVFSGMAVTDVRPERIYQGRTAPRGRGFLGRRGGFYMSTFASQLIFDRVTILDRTRLGARKKVRNFWGHARYGIEPFSAELLVEVPMQRPKPKLGRFMTGHWGKANMAPLDRAVEAIRVSKSISDTIRIDTTVHRRVQLKDALRLGTFKLGEMRRLG